jgi:N-acetylglucosamine kinase-like BadF-type ATPase
MKTNSREPIYGIGIDTGGTYTDAVLLDLRKHQVISLVLASLILAAVLVAAVGLEMINGVLQ